MDLADRIFKIVKKKVETLIPLSCGPLSKVFIVHFKDGQKIVAKTGATSNGISTEGFVINFLKKNTKLPVPKTIYYDNTLLLMEFIGSNQPLTCSIQIEVADQIAALHNNTSTTFGFERDTVIGGLLQPNPQTTSWIVFFRDHRLKFMARKAYDAGRLPARLVHQIDNVCDKLERKINEPSKPRLIHGDLWSGNILTCKDKLSGFIDPAPYFANKEIELAFITLFATLDNNFFSRYREHHTIRPGFFEERKDIYNLYPLLIHAYLFGGHYISEITRILGRFMK